MNQRNIDINSWNFGVCLIANARVNDSSTPEQRKAVNEWLNGPEGLQKECAIGVDQEYLNRQCDDLIGSGVISVDDLINGWSNELEQYDLLNPEVQMRMCVERFCRAGLSSLDALNAGNVCYEYEDNRGCLEELCGPLGLIKNLFGVNSEEYFMTVKCRQNFFDPDPNFPASPSGTVCHEKYAECLIDKAYDEWRQAKENGTCSLVEQASVASAALLPIVHVSPASNFRHFDTYQAFRTAYANFQVEECAAAYSLCEENRERAVRAAADFVHVTSIPRVLAEKIDLPDPPQSEFIYRDIDKYTKKLADIAVSLPDESAVITPENALQQMATVPEVMQSLSKFMGQNTFFALFGTEGYKRVFGSAVVAEYQGTDFKPDSHYTVAQRALLPSLKGIRAIRQTIYSPATATILRAAATNLTQETMFNFVRSATDVSTADELNVLIEGLANQMQ